LIDPLTHLTQKEKIYFFKEKKWKCPKGRGSFTKRIINLSILKKIHQVELSADTIMVLSLLRGEHLARAFSF
jgi:hypothetical protein